MAVIGREAARAPLTSADINDGIVGAADLQSTLDLSSKTITMPSIASLDVTGNLTVDTSTLHVDATNNRVGIGTSSPAYKLDVASPVIQFGDSTDAFAQYKSSAGNWHVGANSSNAFAFYSGTYGSGTERMRIDSSGNVAIGDPVANSRLTVTEGTAGAKITLKTGGNAVGSIQGFAAYDRQGTAAFPSDPGQLGGYIYVERDGSGGTYDLTFGTADGVSNNAAERLRLTYHGYLRMASGTGGIQFGGATAAANTLDDYEEGTFGVSAAPNTSGTVTLNASYDTLSYTKVGRVVTINGEVRISSVGSPVGLILVLSNLPFVVANLGDFSGRANGCTYGYINSTVVPQPFRCTEGSTEIWLDVDCSTLGSANEFGFSFSYFTT